jgi:hypothetical protein
MAVIAMCKYFSRAVAPILFENEDPVVSSNNFMDFHVVADVL